MTLNEKYNLLSAKYNTDIVKDPTIKYVLLVNSFEANAKTPF